MDEKRLEELSFYGIKHYTLPSGWGKRSKSADYFGTYRSVLDLYIVATTPKKCPYCNKKTYRWTGSAGSYMCYDGCFSTTGYDSRTPDGWPMWIERDGREVKGATMDESCT